MLWVGWFGFNAGSQLAADGVAANALVVTHVAAATAGLVWALIEWVRNGKATVLGIITGAVAGLVAITPACGFVNTTGALFVGIGAAFFAYIAVAIVKEKLGYDDSLDVWGVHGVAGIWGAIATGIWVVGDYAHGSQVLIQCKAVAYTLVYSGVVSFIILKVLDLTLGIRADEQAERVGLDLSDHAEAAYTIVD
jgi:Amt family ammonium transporter